MKTFFFDWNIFHQGEFCISKYFSKTNFLKIKTIVVYNVVLCMVPFAFQYELFSMENH